VTDIISGGGGTGMGSIANGCKQDTSAAMDPTTVPGKNGESSALEGERY